MASRNRRGVSRAPRSAQGLFVARVRCVLALFGLALLLVALRSMQLQIYQHNHLARLAREQYVNPVRVAAHRGVIYDRQGSALAVSVEVPSVYASPNSVVDPQKTAKTLALVLNLPESVLLDRLMSNRYFVWLKRHISPDMAQQITALNLPGVALTKEPRRFYPHREVGAQVIGFAGLDARGLEGIEKQLDQELLGEAQVVYAMRDARGHAVLAGGLDKAQLSHGHDVRLTIDLQLQHDVQQVLQQALAKSRATSAMAVVLDVATADILAMGVVPTFNANTGASAPTSDRRNRLITDMFEPGSTLKPLVVAAALDTGTINADSIFFAENGRYHVGGHNISDTSSHGWMGLSEILAKSSNIAMAKIGLAMGKTKLEQALRDMQLTQRTGIELPGEVSGMLRPAAVWSPLETATIAFGQGIAVNAMQLAAAYRALAADGMYQAPRLVLELTKPGAKQFRPATLPARRLFTTDTARRITKMLEASVTPKEGTGRLAAIEGYRVAGKTGTAQKADPLTGGYSRDRYVATFAGFVPADAPRVVIVVVIDEPQTSHYGGTVAAPVFSEIGLAAMQRLGVLANTTTTPLDLHHEAVDMDALFEENNEELQMVDVLPDAPGSLPSFMGLTGRQALERYVKAKLPANLVINGSGLVVAQEPAVGSRVQAGRQIHLTLAP